MPLMAVQSVAEPVERWFDMSKQALSLLSPAYAADSGEGSMGRMLNPAKAAELEQERLQKEKEAAEAENYARQAQIASMYKTSFKNGGKVSSASKRADGCAIRGRTKGKLL